MTQRVNSDLANDLGNLVSRTLKMVEKYCDGKVPERSILPNEKLKGSAIDDLKNYIPVFMNKLEFHKALIEIWKLITAANKHIEDTAPWKLSKDESNKEKLDSVLYDLIESLRLISVFINPFMPDTSLKILARLGYKDYDIDWNRDSAWGQIKPGAKVEKGENLFPRIE
jgi:methionyl-tRNA synthetase